MKKYSLKLEMFDYNRGLYAGNIEETGKASKYACMSKKWLVKNLENGTVELVDAKIIDGKIKTIGYNIIKQPINLTVDSGVYDIILGEIREVGSKLDIQKDKIRAFKVKAQMMDSDDYIFEVINNRIALKRYTGKAAKLTVPSIVQIVCAEAFKGAPIKSLKIEGKVELRAKAFESMNMLEEIELYIPNLALKNKAFSHLGSLRKVILGNCARIGDNAFESCNRLSQVIVESNEDTLLGNRVFYDCDNLSTLTTGNIQINNYVLTINNQARYSNKTFSGAISLKKVIINVDGYTMEDEAFEICSSIEQVEMKECSLIGKSAFDSCKELSTVTINKGETIIDDYAFDYCRNLTDIIGTIRIKRKNPFRGCGKISVEKIYK